MFENEYNDSNTITNASLWIKSDDRSWKRLEKVTEFYIEPILPQGKCNDFCCYSLIGINKEPYTFSGTIKDAYVNNHLMTEIKKRYKKYAYQSDKRLAELKFKHLHKKFKTRRRTF